MTAFVAGLTLFFAVHSVRIIADGWRERQIERFGTLPWKAGYALISAAGLALMIWGYGETRFAAELWSPPQWTRHLAALLTLPALVLVAAAYVPGNRLRLALGHPMLLGVKLWALAHLLCNGRVGDLLLFGSFLLWSALAFSAARKRDRASPRPRPAGRLLADLATFALGIIAWAAMAFGGHEHLIGIRPMG